MPKLLSMCPSGIRPDRIQEMLSSFDKTKSEGTDIAIYVSETDPKLEEYKQVLKDRNLIIGKKLHIVNVFNYFSCELFPDYQYYQTIDDDHIYHTPGWDKILINDIETKGNGWGIACGKDLIHVGKEWEQPDFFPSAQIISANIVKALGYYCTPLIEHVCCDLFFRDIANGIGKFFKNPDVIIEHKHWCGGKVACDDQYRFSTGQKQMEKDTLAYQLWCSRDRNNDIRKILNACSSPN